MVVEATVAGMPNTKPQPRREVSSMVNALHSKSNTIQALRSKAILPYNNSCEGTKRL
jgi:hypothetical protein